MYAYLLVIAVVLIPQYKVAVNVPSLRPEDVLTVFAIAWLWLSGRRSLGQLVFERHLRSMTVPFLMLLGYLLLLTLAMSGIAGQGSFILAINRSLGLFRGLLVAIALFHMIHSPRHAQRIAYLIILLIFVAFGLMVLQRHNLFGINQWYTPLWAFEDMKWQVITGKRASGFRGNPNDIGTVLSVFCAVAICRAIFGKGVFWRVVGAAAVLIAMIGTVFFASSRQGTIGIACTTIVAIGLGLVRQGRRKSAIVLALVGGAAIIYGLVFMESSGGGISERFSVISGGNAVSSDSSMIYRFETWPSFFSAYGGWVFVGKGIDELVRGTIWDSGYLYLLATGGIGAIITFLWITIGVSLHALKRTRTYATAETNWLHLAVAVTAPTLLVTNIVNHTLTNSVIMTCIAIVYAASFAAMQCEDRALHHARYQDNRGPKVNECAKQFSSFMSETRV